MRCAAEGEDALLGAGFFLIAPSAAERSRKAVLVQCLLERLCFHDIGVGRAVIERVDALRDAVLIDIFGDVTF